MRTDGVTRLVSWNIQGHAGVDVPGMARALRDIGADIVVFQEVQRRQLADLRDATGYGEQRWAFKHWPLTKPAEGLGVISNHRIRSVRRQTVSRGEAFWMWRRRIALHLTLSVAGHDFYLVNTHLGSGVPEAVRTEQAARIVAACDSGAVVAGDLNTTPGSPTLDRFAAHGCIDAWSRLHPGAAHPHTNWSGPRSNPPIQRLDYVLVPDAQRVVDAWVPDDWRAFAPLSDHLPVVVDLDLSPAQGTPRD